MIKTFNDTHFFIWIHNKDIFPIKSVFFWTQSKEILSAKLYKNLQRALSPQEYLFTWNRELFISWDKEHNRQIYDLFTSYVVIDPDKLPPRFLELFALDPTDLDVQAQVISLFQKARFLDDSSARIIFLDDTIIIFRNEERLVHTKRDNLTSWEKRRSHIVTSYSTFSNIYDATRSQYHTINSAKDKQDDYTFYKQTLLTLAQDIAAQWYEKWADTYKRKLDDIIQDISGATNFRVLWASLHHLKSIAFEHSFLDRKHLEGAQNRFSKRLTDLQKQIGIIQFQLHTLERILWEHEQLLQLFLSQIQFTHADIALENYLNSYGQLLPAYWPISPFCFFHKWIVTYKNNPSTLTKALHYVRLFFRAFQEEHQMRLLENKEEQHTLDTSKDNLALVEHFIKHG